MANRKGMMIWKNHRIDWEHQTISASDFTVNPHFKIKCTNNDGDWAEWPNITIDTDEKLHNSLKGVSDFTKLPESLISGILDNCVKLLNEPEQELTRIEVPKPNLGG